ncbi:MAG: glycosyltransferase, partial [Gaiellaceae bacterium]
AGLRHVRAFRRLRPDVVHLSLRHPYACQWGTLAGLLSPGAAVVAVEQLPIPPANARQARIKQQLAKRLDAHVAVGRDAGRELEEWVGLPRGSIATIYNARPSGTVSGRSEADQHVSCVAVGRLHEQKGFDLLIDALSDVPDVSLRLVGDGVERASLEAHATARGVYERVEFLGWLDDPTPELERGDIFVLPSRYEGLPLSIIEAMFAELPVVAADVGSVRELVVDGETGLLVPPEDVQAIAAAMTSLAGDRERRRRLGSAARERALARFSLETMLERYRELYEGVHR